VLNVLRNGQKYVVTDSEEDGNVRSQCGNVKIQCEEDKGTNCED
jgi:uncharacterized protein YlzI (FlbEa/FlbD family)